MELLTGDRQILNTSDFPDQISPFPATGNILFSSPTALLDPPDVSCHNMPPQKLRPIRGSSKSPSNSMVNNLFPATVESQELDETLDKLGLLRDGHRVCGVNEEASEYFDSLEKVVEDGDVAVVGSGVQCHLNSEGGVSNDETSSSSADDVMSVDIKVSVHHKRKRKTRKKFERFLENLVMEVMHKQEQMHNQMIDMLERKERERIIKEEAWRQQEIERMKIDEVMTSKENSRNLALISLIQKLTGEEIKIQLPSIISHREANGCNVGYNPPVGNDFSDASNRRKLEDEEQGLVFEGFCVSDEVSVGMQSRSSNSFAKKCREKWENTNKCFERSSSPFRNEEKQYKDSTCSYFQELDIFHEVVTGKSP